jgi:hypothetical protein
MYIASAEELIIGHSDSSLTDATSLSTTNYTNYLYFDGSGIQMNTARGTVQLGYNLEAPGTPQHFHINKVDQSFDLFFGDDANFLQLPVGGGGPVIGANDGSSGQKLYAFGQNGVLIIPGEIESAADTGPVRLKSYDGSTIRTWSFETDGTVTFPDGTVQTTAYRVMSVPPNTPWGAIVGYDGLSFLFDPTQSGSPAFNGGWGGGGGAYNTLIWSAEVYQQLASPNNLSFAVSTPVQYFNYNTASPLTETVLTPGDYFVMRILDVGTNRVYRATFLAGYNAASVGTETQCGAITVERLV